MKQLFDVLMIAVVVVGTILVVILTAEPRPPVNVNTINEQPQREKYVAPEWVVNERGQRCIKQGSTVTCG
jgi:hypothetical protein